MISFFDRLFFDVYSRNVQRLDDIYSFPLVERYIPRKGFFPITGSSLGFHSIATIINDIEINRRSNIIEFGAGLSTIMLAKYAFERNRNLRITTVEHDLDYLKVLREVLEKEGVSDRVNLIHAGLENSCFAGVDREWYSLGTLVDSAGEDKFDLVIIDGPISKRKSQDVRTPAIDFISKRLADSYSVYLDDIHRSGERAIMLDASKIGLQFRKVSRTFALAHRGLFYNPIP